ncbi:MAG: hypothetical protein KC482_01400 [Dehalococcoidia bacterium]|nr:hypothetical protein [Dehalococcoidia bacterium]
MAEGMESLDVTKVSALKHLAETVWSTGEVKLLRRGRTALALVMPLGVKHWKTSEGRESFASAAGAWEAVDTDTFLRANRSSRASSYRPPVDW